jgi:TorA maturation chaperone TorD
MLSEQIDGARPGETARETLEFAAAARQRAALYAFLAALLNQPPQAALVQRLRGAALEPLFDLVGEQEGAAGVRAGLEAIVVYLAETAALDVDAAAQQLAVDWMRLFRGLRRGIGPVPPYESLYTGDEQGTRVIGAVMSAYRRNGAELCDGVHNQADYLGLEFGYLGYLGEREAQAWEAGEEVQAAYYFQAAVEFRQAHPGRWAGEFCDAAALEARTSFYRGAVLLMKAVLDD